MGLRSPDSLLVRGSRINKYESLCPGCERTPAGPIAAGTRPVPGTAACRVCRPGRESLPGGEQVRLACAEERGARMGSGHASSVQPAPKCRLPGAPAPLWLGEATRSPSGSPAGGGRCAGTAALGPSVRGPGGRGWSRRSEARRGCAGSGPRHSARREFAPSSPLEVARGGRCSRARSGLCSSARSEGTHRWQCAYTNTERALSSC